MSKEQLNDIILAWAIRRNILLNQKSINNLVESIMEQMDNK